MFQSTHPLRVRRSEGRRQSFRNRCHNHLQQERRPNSSDLLLRPKYIILMDLPLDSGKGGWTALYRR